jgi:hypothetical protein
MSAIQLTGMPIVSVPYYIKNIDEYAKQEGKLMTQHNPLSEMMFIFKNLRDTFKNTVAIDYSYTNCTNNYFENMEGLV